MKHDEKLLADLQQRISVGYVAQNDTYYDAEDHQLIVRCERMLKRLIKQNHVSKELVTATHAMFESTGVTQEVRAALEKFDGRRRPLTDGAPRHFKMKG